MERREGDLQQDRSSIDLHQILVFGKKEKEQDQIQERIIDLSLEMVKDFGQNPANMDIIEQDRPRWT